MPDEKSSQDPAGNAQQPPLPLSEPPRPPEQRRRMREPADNNPAYSQQDSKELAREIHWVEKATMWSQIGLGVIGIFALIVYHGQLGVMRDQVNEMRSSSADTHALAETAKDQASAAVAQMQILRKSLEYSERPWISVVASIAGPLIYKDLLPAYFAQRQRRRYGV